MGPFFWCPQERVLSRIRRSADGTPPVFAPGTPSEVVGPGHSQSPGGRSWRTRSPLPSGIGALCASDLAALTARPDVQIVRDKRLRRTLLVPCGEHLALVKELRPLTGGARLRAWVRGHPGRREWYWARRFLAAGVPVPRPWAFARGRHTESSWFVQEGLPAADHLLHAYNRFFAPFVPPRDQVAWARFARQLGNLVARVHRAGADHPDLHPGNILCTGDDPRALQLHLVDYHSVRRGWGPARVYRTRNLLKFVAGLAQSMPRPDVEDILGAYVAAMPAGAFPSAELLAERVYGRLPGLTRRRVLSRARRSLVPSSAFAVAREGPRRIWYRRAYPLRDIRAVLAQVMADPPAPHAPDRPAERRYAELEPGRRVFVESFAARGLQAGLQRITRRSPGRQRWYEAERAHQETLTPPWAVAYVEERMAWNRIRSFVIGLADDAGD